jgi:hypothetical protein
MIKRFTWFLSLVDNGGDVPSGTSTMASIKTFNPQAGHPKDFLAIEVRANCGFEEFY